MGVTQDRLVGFPLFAGLTSDELEKVAAWGELRACSPGDCIVGEGASGYSFFVIRTGSAVVTRDGEELRRLGPGDFFGELAMLGDGRRSATITALEPTTLVAFFGTEFRRLEAELPTLAARVYEAVEQRAEAR